MSRLIEYETVNKTAYIRFNRPDKGNAISWEMWSAVGEAIHDADQDNSIRSIIITGNGDVFCAGGDLEDLLPKMVSGEIDLRPEDPEEDMMLRRNSVTTPLIAAINGPCLAGGMEFLQATDIRIAERQASFGLPEVSWGLVPAGGTHTRLPRQIPYALAMEMILTGEQFSAERAFKMGIVNEVVPKGKSLEAAEGYAETINSNGPEAVQKAKEIVTWGLSVSLNQSFTLEQALAKEVIQSGEAEKGLTAYRKNQKPEF